MPGLHVCDHLIQIRGIAQPCSCADLPIDDGAAAVRNQSERLTAIGVMLRGPGTARVPEAV
jgi:hypothetical protein